MTTTAEMLMGLFCAYSLHCAGAACEAVLGDDPSETCRRCCRIARWLSVVALATIAGLYGLEAIVQQA